MSNGAVTFCSSESFLSKQMFKLKVNAALKECMKIKENVKQRAKISKQDIIANIVISDLESNNIEDKYFAFKGYNSDGSLKPLKIYTIKNGDILNAENVKDRGILVIDLYESSICIHNFTVEGQYAEGYLVKNEKSKEGYNIIFSSEKVKVFMRNANTHHEYTSVHEFLNGYLF